jgi:hypothetical protein
MESRQELTDASSVVIMLLSRKQCGRSTSLPGSFGTRSEGAVNRPSSELVAKLAQ